MADNSGRPDYHLPERLQLTSEAQHRALFEQTRSQIVSILLERAATTSELAEALDKPKGTVGHHLKVLEEAGLVRVVRTERVRALEAKYYGRTARTFLYHLVGEAAGEPQRILATAAAEIATVATTPEATAVCEATANLRYARIPAERAREWAERLNDLVFEFTREPRAGDVTYAMVVGLYPTRRRPLPPAGRDEPEPGPGGSGEAQ